MKFVEICITLSHEFLYILCWSYVLYGNCYIFIFDHNLHFFFNFYLHIKFIFYLIIYFLLQTFINFYILCSNFILITNTTGCRLVAGISHYDYFFQVEGLFSCIFYYGHWLPNFFPPKILIIIPVSWSFIKHDNNDRNATREREYIHI